MKQNTLIEINSGTDITVLATMCGTICGILYINKHGVYGDAVHIDLASMADIRKLEVALEELKKNWLARS